MRILRAKLWILRATVWILRETGYGVDLKGYDVDLKGYGAAHRVALAAAAGGEEPYWGFVV
eukprot:8778192-Pyramimonas_sp.AAC.2